ncbi:MAG: iron hydrogenase, partial [Clostridium sp.]|nr:iron hydrogenase [Clostridium sp.]
FVEGMGCIGGCVGGPKAIIPKEQGKIAVDNFAYHSPIKVATHSTTMDNVLEKLNITSLQDFEDDTKTAIFHRDFK